MTPEAVLSPASTSLPWAAAYPASVDWHMPIPTGPVPDLLDRAARQFPDNPAISFLGRVTRYADLAAEVDRVAAGLQKIGVKRGAKLAFSCRTTPTFIVYYFAILKAGGTVVNFNPLYTLEELAFQAKDSETEIMVTHDLAALFSQDRRPDGPRRHRARHRRALRAVAAAHQVGPVPRFQETRHCHPFHRHASRRRSSAARRYRRPPSG